MPWRRLRDSPAQTARALNHPFSSAGIVQVQCGIVFAHA
jgi:hypothetical protein